MMLAIKATFLALLAVALCQEFNLENEEEEFSGPIRICRKGSDEQINNCFRRILSDLKPRLADGIPEIGLQPLDPFYLDRLGFKQGSGALKIIATFTNLTIRHLSEFQNAEFKLNSKEKRVYYKLDFPKVRIDGTYTLDGNVLIFPLGGSGPYWFELGDVSAHGFLTMEVDKDANNTAFVAIANVNMDLIVRDIEIKLINLFNGNKILGPVINNVLNENAQELYLEIKPNIVKIVKNIVKNIANAIIRNMTFLVDLAQ